MRCFGHGETIISNEWFITLKTAVEREKTVQAIEVQREWTHCVVTFCVLSQCVHFSVRQGGVQTFVIQPPFLDL